MTYSDGEPFPGTVGRELADSVQAYPAVVRPIAGTPNVLLIVLDDVGYAQIGCFGSDVAGLPLTSRDRIGLDSDRM